MVGISYDRGVLLFTVKRTQRKIFEIYDQIDVFGASAIRPMSKPCAWPPSTSRIRKVSCARPTTFRFSASSVLRFRRRSSAASATR